MGGWSSFKHSISRDTKAVGKWTYKSVLAPAAHFAGNRISNIDTVLNSEAKAVSGTFNFLGSNPIVTILLIGGGFIIIKSFAK